MKATLLDTALWLANDKVLAVRYLRENPEDLENLCLFAEANGLTLPEAFVAKPPHGFLADSVVNDARWTSHQPAN
jgi:hypothetical protein